MDESGPYLQCLDNCLDIRAQKIRCFKINNVCYIWVWRENKIFVYEVPLSVFDEEHENDNPKNNRIGLVKNEITIDCNVTDVFMRNMESFFALDIKGNIFAFQSSSQNSNNSAELMEVEDLFSSPSADAPSKWKEQFIVKLKDCGYTVGMHLLSNEMAILSLKEKCLAIYIYSLPKYDLKFIFDLHKYNSEEAVLSSCMIRSMAPSLKKIFQENLEVLDFEIVVVGLNSGLVLWFCANTPAKGLLMLCSGLQKVQSVHWIKDSSSDLYVYLLIVFTSGEIKIFGTKQTTTLFLADCVKLSWCLKNFVITSNFIDSFASELLLNEEVVLNCISLPVKGICAMTDVPVSDTLLIAATIHGSLYYFNPTLVPVRKQSQFILPDEGLLNNMFNQTQQLERIYKQLTQEENTLSALTIAVASNCTPNLFQINFKITSDSSFTIVAAIQQDEISFLEDLWTACIEIVRPCGIRDTSFYKLKQDFNFNNKLMLNVNHKLSVGDVVTFELILFLEIQNPLVVVSVGQVEIDACHLLIPPQVLVPNLTLQKTIADVLEDLTKELSNKTMQESKLRIKIPDTFPIISLLSHILQDSKHGISTEEWDRITGGTKFNVQLTILETAVYFDVDVASRELLISCSNTRICHQLKRAASKRMSNSDMKHVAENTFLDIQAIHQMFEIESLHNEPNFQNLELLWKKLRNTVSCNLCL